MKILKHFSIGLWVISVGLFAHGALAATNYIYPLDSWHVLTKHGEDLSNGTFHMGVDAGFELSAGDPVYAVADGIVREAQERTQFGLVVLIEHFPQGQSANVSLYGHLSPRDVRVSPGQTVKAGDVIGVLGSPSENGGWSVHLHHGIYKSPYSGVWVYYGHVNDPNTANAWFDPESYIAKHLINDTWSPTIQWNFENGQIVGDSTLLTTTVRDIGSGVKSIKYRARTDSSESWTTLSSTEDASGNYSSFVSLADFPDGDIKLRVVVIDNFGNRTVLTKRLVKDPDRYTTPAFVAMKGVASDAFVTQWSFGGTSINSFSPFGSNWSKGGDIAAGDVTGNAETDVVVAKGSSNSFSSIGIFSADGNKLNSWRPFKKGAIRVSTGDVDGDGKDEIIVGSGKRQISMVKVFKRNGTLLWSVTPFGYLSRDGVDVSAGDINNDGKDEVIVASRWGAQSKVAVISADGSRIIKRFKPFNKYSGGFNVASGDIDGDSKADIIVGTEKNSSGTVKIFSGRGKPMNMHFLPFGQNFHGSVDVSLMQWDDNNGKLELVTSQSSKGQAWVKIYRFSDQLEILLTKRVYEANFEGGTRVAGW